MRHWTDQLTTLAAQLPTGLVDPKVLDKLAAETLEQLAEPDPVSSAMEGADRIYYAAKAVANGVMTIEDAEQVLVEAALVSGIEPDVQIAVAVQKYTLRAQPGNPKNHAAEWRACAGIIGVEYGNVSPVLGCPCI